MSAGIVAVSLVLTLAGVISGRRPRSREERTDWRIQEAWLEAFSTDAYRPMLRLAELLDTDYITREVSAEEATRYRRRQRRLLREYLHAMARDFQRLHSIATEAALQSASDRENRSVALMDERMRFIFAMWNAEFRLFLNEFAPCMIDLQPLLTGIQELADRAREVARRRLELRVS